jgi:hypothetical protein
MPIRVFCPHGHLFQTEERNAGRQITCPVCRVQVMVPAVGSRPHSPLEPIRLSELESGGENILPDELPALADDIAEAETPKPVPPPAVEAPPMELGPEPDLPTPVLVPDEELIPTAEAALPPKLEPEPDLPTPLLIPDEEVIPASKRVPPPIPQAPFPSKPVPPPIKQVSVPVQPVTTSAPVAKPPEAQPVFPQASPIVSPEEIRQTVAARPMAIPMAQVASSEPVEVVDDDMLDDRPVRKRRVKKHLPRGDWYLTNLGLGFQYAKILCYVGVLTLTLVSFMVMEMIAAASVGAAQHDRPVYISALGLLVGVTSLIAALGFFVTPILGLTGSILALWTPPKSGARTLALIVLGLDGAGLFLTFVGMILGTAMAGFSNFMQAGGVTLIVILFAMALSYGAWGLFMFYARQLAIYFGDRATADEAMRLTIIITGVFLGGGLLLIVLSPLVLVTCIGPVIMFALFVGWLITYLKFLFDVLHVVAGVRQRVSSAT